MYFKLYRILTAFFLLVVIGCGKKEYLSPGSIAIDRNADKLYTSLTTAHKIAVTSLAENTTEYISLRFNPNRLLISSERNVMYVSHGDADGGVAIIYLNSGEVVSDIAVGHTPEEMILSKDGRKLYVAVRYLSSIVVIDTDSQKIIDTIWVGCEPRSVSLTPDGRRVVVGCFLPSGSALDSVVSSQIVVIDCFTDSVCYSVALSSGGHSVHDIVVDGNYAYASHVISRFTVPVTQLDRGWVNSNAVSVIDVQNGKLVTTVLLDDVDHGASNLSGMCVTENMLYVTAAGSNELISLDLKALADKLEKNCFRDVSSDLSFASDFKKRIKLSGKSPRFVVSCGDNLYVSNKFSPFLDVVDKETFVAVNSIVLGVEPKLSRERLGEYYFFTSDICYQSWQSCASCHPDARADALNWDLQNDGLGNPKNTKSMLYSHKTPPCMITGIRADAEIAVRKGILHTMGTVQADDVAAAIDDYLISLKGVESPYLKSGKLSEAAQRGEIIYKEVGCANCHNGTYFTDGKSYFVGVADTETEKISFDTPTLCEVWRTAPYLYDGRAATVKEIFTKYNHDNLHGVTSEITDSQIDDLTEYVLSL